eukprot:SAG31_NODE_3797_length_3874_cov_2.483444_1_plen_245_part_00
MLKVPSCCLQVALALLILFVGVVFVGAGAGGTVGASAIVITLVSAFCEAAHVVSIRRAVVRLHADHRGNGSGQNSIATVWQMHSAAEHDESAEDSEGEGLLDSGPQADKICRGHASYYAGSVQQPKAVARIPELLMLKLALSLVFIAPIALAESSGVLASPTGLEAEMAPFVSLSASGRQLPYFGARCVWPALGLGVAVTGLFQGLMVSMATRMSAISIGACARRRLSSLCHDLRALSKPHLQA